MPSGFAENESNHSPPSTASSDTVTMSAFKRGINHQRRQQVNLRAQPVARARRASPRQTRRETRSSKSRLAGIDSFKQAPTLVPTRRDWRSVSRRPRCTVPYSTDCTSTILPMGMPLGKTPPSPLVRHVLAGFQIGAAGQVGSIPDERRVRAGRRRISTPMSCVAFSTSAETRQFGSPISTTCELT